MWGAFFLGLVTIEVTANAGLLSTLAQTFYAILYKCYTTSTIRYLGRITNFFDKMFIDEVQDFSSDDLDWVLTLASLEMPVTVVGDYYQKTYATSNRGNKGHSDFLKEENWISRFESAGFFHNSSSLGKSWRCAPAICDFVRENLGVEIYSEHSSNGEKVRLLEEPQAIEEIMLNDDIPKLFLRSPNKYKVKSTTWGKSKGETYKSVCVVLNKTTYKFYIKQRLSDLAPQTKARFYVACTRTAGDLFFVSQESIPKKFQND